MRPHAGPSAHAAALVLAGSLALVGAGCRQQAPRARGDASRPVAARAAESRAPDFPPVTDALLAAPDAGAAWPVYGGSYANRRYSTLAQIDRTNVRRLGVVWIYQTGHAQSFETTPLVVGRELYLTTPESGVVALDAATGRKLWEYAPPLGTVALCCGPNNRGVALYGDLAFVGTLDAHLLALDRRTGRPVWETQVADAAQGYSITMAPLAFDGSILVGVAGGEYGIRGLVAAYDARTGRPRWRWHAIPAANEAPNGWWGEWKETDPWGTPLQRDIAAEREDSARYPEAWQHGGGGIWMTPAYDPATATLYLVVGNPAPDLDGRLRPGDNLYTGSLVALDARTGQLRWYLQLVPHDVWDLSPASPPFLFDLDGRRLVGEPGKTGWLYVVDAASGRPVLRSDNFVPQEGLFTRPTEEGVRMAPGGNGGANGSPAAYSPRTGLAYVLGIHQPMVFRRAFQPREPGRPWLGGSFTAVPGEPTWGTFSAIDVRTGEIRWQRRVPAPMAGAALATAGGLVFVGQSTGTFDAFDAETGELLWQFRAGAGVHGGPITYLVDGIQYVAVAAGGNHHLDTPRGDDLIVFALQGGEDRAAVPPPQYPAARYTRHGPVRTGLVRQVPAAQLGGGGPPAAAGAGTTRQLPR